ncbi:MAG TPA: hypothetical protein VE781_01595 [Kineosporiaceae bacterium]|nr:hypothetical protein [Kineosporiaceae bacterium]
MSLEVVPGDPRWGEGRSSRSSGYRSRTYYLPDDLHFRMRNAWWHTQTQAGGHDSISELVASALLPVVEELEARYNGGDPFPEIPERRRPKTGPSGHARQAHALRLRAAMRREGAQADQVDEFPDASDLSDLPELTGREARNR